MKITIYELLEMVKEGKAPKKVRYNDEIYDTKTSNNFSLMIYEATGKMSDDGEVGLFLNDEVEILEEPKKIPEKLNIDKEHNRLFKKDGSYWSIKAHQVYVYEVLNEIIDYLKSKGE